MPHKDPETARQYSRERRRRPEIKAREKAYRERAAEKRKAWFDANKDHRREYMRKWRAENREHRADYKRKYEHETHREQHLAQRKSYRERNRERINKWFCDWKRSSPKLKEWQERNADKLRQQAKARQGRGSKNYTQRLELYRELRSVLGDAHPRKSAIVIKWQLCNEICYICGLHLHMKDISIDHVIPISNQGTNDIENLMPTHLMCNKKKRAHLDFPCARPDLVVKMTIVKSIPRRPPRRYFKSFENAFTREAIRVA